MDVPVAVQFVQPPDSMHVNDTVLLHVQILNRSGDTIPGLPILLSALDTLVSVDTTRVAVIAKHTGIGHVVARTTSGPPSAPLPIPIK